MTADQDGARRFYGEVLGWEAEEANPEFGGYFNFLLDGVRVAGCMGRMPDNPTPDVWSVYLAVEDAEKTLTAAEGAGAQVIVPAMAVADLGSMGVFIDPTGAATGLWQPGTHTGFGRVQEPGAPAWFELMTRDYAAALTFYRDVFGWQTKTMGDTPEFTYSVVEHGDQWHCGVMDVTAHLPAEIPAHWEVTFGCADTDATVAKAVSLGASVVMPAEDTEYGRIAGLTDPTGALFKLVAANEQMPQPAT